ncbi:hypothetical protein MC885_012825, partial [Smutsia gigantea]
RAQLLKLQNELIQPKQTLGDWIVRLWFLKEPEEPAGNWAVCQNPPCLPVQMEIWVGKKTPVRRKLVDGKMGVDSAVNNVTCTDTYKARLFFSLMVTMSACTKQGTRFLSHCEAREFSGLQALLRRPRRGLCPSSSFKRLGPATTAGCPGPQGPHNPGLPALALLNSQDGHAE